MKYRSYNKTEKNKCKDYSKSAMRFVRGFTAVILIVIQIFLNVFLLNPCGVSAATDSQESIASDTISSGERNDDTESYVLYDSTTKEFELNGTVLSALVCVYEKGIEFKSIKNTITEHEWIDGTSATELVEIYYDNKSVKHNFDWKYYGCFLYEDDTKLTFEFRSANGKFTCLQECFINRLDADGDVLSVSNTIISNDTTEISLPEKFSSVSVQMTAREDYYMQYLNQTVCDAKVSAEDVIRFSIGNDDNFDMSIPLCYYSAKGVHGVAFGTGVFSPEHSSVVDVAVSDECMIASAKSAYKVFYGEKDITYAFPTFFCCVFDGNNNIGKNLIKSWSAAEKIDAYGSLPLTYENIVGVFDPENIESVRTAFYNMQFFFSASDVRNNMYSNIKNDLEACLSDDVNAYNYIFRSAMFSDFDYSKAGLVDGTVLKDCAAENDELYRTKLASVMLSGRHYPILPNYSEGGWDGIGYYDSLNKKGALFVFRDGETSADTKYVTVHDVDPTVEYKITSCDGSVDIERITGADLLEKGLQLTMQNGSVSDIIYIEAAEVDLADVKILLFGNELSSLETIAIAVIFIFAIGVVIAAIIINAEEEYIEK